jgi:hypothetical protein
MSTDYEKAQWDFDMALAACSREPLLASPNPDPKLKDELNRLNGENAARHRRLVRSLRD